MENNMEPPIPNQNPIATPNVIPPQPIAENAPVIQTPVKRSFDPRYVLIILILIGLGGGFMLANKKPITTPAPTPTETPTPTPKTKSVVPIATQSAYLEIASGVASLSAAINVLQISDTTMSPPTVEIPLGFPN